MPTRLEDAEGSPSLGADQTGGAEDLRIIDLTMERDHLMSIDRSHVGRNLSVIAGLVEAK